MVSDQSLSLSLTQLQQSLRAGQQSLGEWTGGEWAVSAVPGAGKSHSLSVAAAIAIARHQLQPQRQLFIVTFTRSAGAAIKQKIKERLKELSLPTLGFSVQTIHGFALQIASRHPELSGYDLARVSLINDYQQRRLVKDSVENWLQRSADRFRELLETGEFDGEETERLRRQSVLRSEVLPSLAITVVKEAKSSGLSPQALQQLSVLAPDGILAIAAGLYEEYQTLMNARNWFDYDDMILGALKVLDHPQICEQWQRQVFGIFEDEAQDSSPLQAQLINRLAYDPVTQQTHLIRVGDPNQAINSTFTPADPIYFHGFCERCEKQGKFTTMDQAGRSHLTIIQAANFMVQWVNQAIAQSLKVSPVLGDVLNPVIPFRLQAIQPVSPGDPQPNPVVQGQTVELREPDDIFQSIQLIKTQAIALLKANPDHNAAILVREHRQAHFIASQLEDLPKQYHIRLYEVGASDRVHQIPKEILSLCQFLDRPHSPDLLKNALEILQKKELIPTQDLNALALYPEKFLYPSPLEPVTPNIVNIARNCCRQLLQAKLDLPPYHLITFLGSFLNYDGSQMATLHKLAEQIQPPTQPSPSLKSIITALQEMVNADRFEGVEEDGEEIYTRPQQITIMTMHKAKGLDWDYVFLPFLQSDTIPGNPWVPAGAKFLGDYTLQEVARAQIRTAVHHQYLHQTPVTKLPDPLTAWEKAQHLKRAEEYRLLYVAMTRAKRLLWLSAERQAPFSWSTYHPQTNPKLEEKTPCPVFTALQIFFQTKTV